MKMTTPRQCPQLIDRRAVRTVIDYGHFEVFDPQAIPSQAPVLHAWAEASPPSSSAGGMAVITSPHQNNFDTSMTVECWSARPAEDRDQWQQVSETIIRVESGELHVGAPGGETSLVAETVPGIYILEASGRGFVNYGWPGSTEPGDEWRLRLWPARTDPGGARAPRLWHQPGYGVPNPVPFRPKTQDAVSVYDEDLSNQSPRQVKSGWDLVPGEFHYANGAVPLNEIDPELLARLMELPATRQREVAWWCTGRALEWASLDTADYIIATLDRIKAGGQPPDLADLFAWLDSSSHDDQEGTVPAEQGSWERIEHSRQQHPYARGEISRPHHAIAAITAVAIPNPLHAAVETLHAACATYSDQAPRLLERLNTEFDLSKN